MSNPGELFMKTRRMSSAFLILCLVVVTGRAMAEQSQDFGEYVVHFNAVTTALLSPEMASHYNIQRSSNKALLNITVLKKVLGAAASPVEAEVSASAVNLTDQYRDIKMRKVKEEGAIYYLGTMSVDNQETYDFTVNVTPEGRDNPFVVRFRQQFFTR